MQISDIDTRHELDEELRVTLWRTATLSEAGYDDQIALDLALDKNVDLHLARRLMALGCPQATALRILL